MIRTNRDLDVFNRCNRIARNSRAVRRQMARRRAKQTWAMLGVDLILQRVYQLDSGLTARQVVLWCESWHASRTQVVALPWPSNMPAPPFKVALHCANGRH
jgi:hypothetical protein